MTARLFLPLLVVVMALALACSGGDDDGAPAQSSGGGSSAAPADNDAGGDNDSGGDDGDDDEAAPEAPSGGSGSVGFVTIGGETWNIVASVQCNVGTLGGVQLARIHGHAEGDEAIEIELNFDPRDGGLLLVVSGGGRGPAWDASDDFTTQLGGTRISGEGTFVSTSNESAEGSFEATC